MVFESPETRGRIPKLILQNLDEAEENHFLQLCRRPGAYGIATGEVPDQRFARSLRASCHDRPARMIQLHRLFLPSTLLAD